jgi:hypothetical protein
VQEHAVYELIADPPGYQFTTWDYAVDNVVFAPPAAVGHVHQQTVAAPLPANFVRDCVTSSDPTWN